MCLLVWLVVVRRRRSSAAGADGGSGSGALRWDATKQQYDQLVYKEMATVLRDMGAFSAARSVPTANVLRSIARRRVVNPSANGQPRKMRQLLKLFGMCPTPTPLAAVGCMWRLTPMVSVCGVSASGAGGFKKYVKRYSDTFRCDNDNVYLVTKFPKHW